MWNSGGIGGKLGNCVSPMGKQNSLAGKLISPRSGKKGENEGKLFHKNSLLGNLCETGDENEREISFPCSVSIAQYCMFVYFIDY